MLYPGSPVLLTRASEGARLRSVRRYMDGNFARPIDLRELASQAHFSRFHFIRLFSRAYGVTPHRYLVRRRIELAKRLLATTNLPVTEVCFEVGFESVGSFGALFQRETGRSPQQYRLLCLARKQFVPQCFLTMAGIEPGTR